MVAMPHDDETMSSLANDRKAPFEEPTRPSKKAKQEQLKDDMTVLTQPFSSPFYVYHSFFMETLMNYLHDERDLQDRVSFHSSRYDSSPSKGLEQKLFHLVGEETWSSVEGIVQVHFQRLREEASNRAFLKSIEAMSPKIESFEETTATIDSILYSLRGARERQNRRIISSLRVVMLYSKRGKVEILNLRRGDALLAILEPILSDLPFARGTLQLGPTRSHDELGPETQEPYYTHHCSYVIDWGKERLTVNCSDPNTSGDGHYVTESWHRFRLAALLPSMG
jgi:hypothetical protein